jgi:hypothetical protein
MGRKDIAAGQIKQVKGRDRKSDHQALILLAVYRNDGKQRALWAHA